jgi:hypothetical protein
MPPKQKLSLDTPTLATIRMQLRSKLLQVGMDLGAQPGED